MTNKDKRFFNIAKETARLSDFHGTNVGAAVVEGNRVISTGFNSSKTRPLQEQYNRYRNFKDIRDSIPRAHAEINALSPLIGKELDWDRISIYIYREKKTGERGCSRPCPACLRLIKDLGIKNIYFIDENEDFVKEKVLKEQKDETYQ